MNRILGLIWLIILISCGQQAVEQKSNASTNETSTAAVNNVAWTEADKQLNPLVDAYFSLKDALIEWDTVAANKAAMQLVAVGDGLAKDSTIQPEISQLIGSVAAEAMGFLGESDISQKRRAFSMMSQHLLPLLKQVDFKAQPIYQQICPMAFNDTETAFWLSNNPTINNPYLGKKHPKYASGMLHCGELGDSLVVKP